VGPLVVAFAATKARSSKKRPGAAISGQEQPEVARSNQEQPGTKIII